MRLSRYLAYVIDTLSSGAVATGMRYDEIRVLVTRHFKTLLDQQRETINSRGRLGEFEHAVLESSQGVAEAHGADWLAALHEGEDGALRGFQGLHGLSLEHGSEAYRMLAAEFQRGYRDFVKVVLRHDQSLDRYTFDADAAQHLKPRLDRDRTPGSAIDRGLGRVNGHRMGIRASLTRLLREK